MVQKVLNKVVVKQICLMHFLVEEEVEVDKLLLNKWQKLNQLKKHLILLQKIFIMVKSSKQNIIDQDVVKNVMEKVEKMFKNVKHVKEKVLLCRCIKWVQECINKYKNIVINVLVKDKLFQKLPDVNNVKEKKLLKKLKLFKYQLKKEHQIIIQLHYQEKVIKFQMLWLVI